MFNQDEIDALARIVAEIIPASERHGVPGADDPAIMESILAMAARDPETLRRALAAFEDSDGAAAFRSAHGELAAHLQSLVALAYYRDPRVLRSLNAPARAPFPKGYEMPENDLTLTDPVRARGPIWRKVE